jgi:hypothetical protein
MTSNLGCSPPKAPCQNHCRHRTAALTQEQLLS